METFEGDKMQPQLSDLTVIVLPCWGGHSVVMEGSLTSRETLRSAGLFFCLKEANNFLMDG